MEFDYEANEGIKVLSSEFLGNGSRPLYGDVILDPPDITLYLDQINSYRQNLSNASSVYGPFFEPACMKEVKYSHLLEKDALEFTSDCLLRKPVPEDYAAIIVTDPLSLLRHPIKEWHGFGKYFNQINGICDPDIILSEQCQMFRNLINSDLEFIGCGGAHCGSADHDHDTIQGVHWFYFGCKFSSVAKNIPYANKSSFSGSCPPVMDVQTFENTLLLSGN